MTKLAQLIAQREGFGIPGDIPTVRHNPGDLKRSPHSTHPADDPNGIGYIDTDADGWADLERQLRLYAARGLTIQQAIETYAPPTENDTEAYLSFICEGLGLGPDVTVAEALQQDV